MSLPRMSTPIYLLSDSTGETVSAVARAALAQFASVDVAEHHHTLIRSVSQLERILQTIKAHPGPVMFTLVKREMRDAVRVFCEQEQLPCISILGGVITQLSAYFGVATAALPGRQHELNDNYFHRVEAINFALAHDDGQNSWNLNAADVILVGPSRTSKSPTCVYLANKGLKAANVPFVHQCALPDALFQASHPFIVGLLIDAERLGQIRQTRLETLGERSVQGYADFDQIEAELFAARRLFVKQRWPVIDVSLRSVEETTAHILQLYRKFRQVHRVS